MKQDLVQEEAHHSQEIQHLKNKYEEKLKQLHGQNDYLKKQLEKADHPTKQQDDQIAIFEQQLKDLQLTSTASSFSKFIGE